MNKLSSATFWIVIFLIVILLFMNFNSKPAPQEPDLPTLIDLGRSGRIVESTNVGSYIKGVYLEGDEKKDFKTTIIPENLGWFREQVEKSNTDENRDRLGVPKGKTVWPYIEKQKNTLFTQVMFTFMLPILLFVGLWILLMRQIQGSGNKAMSFGKSKAKLVQEGQIKITFKDVAGVDEAVEEVKEIVEYLKDPKKFSRLGGKIPKGVLLIGQPGTGKTLLAKAIAGEANVPFFSISGSDFVEMFVGVGASRVRDLFEQAKKSKPCIVFIDEIDAVGRSRFAGIGGSHDEREQTLNQLLVEMDGFAENEGVILLAATNRPDVLDPALLRPGRFDRQVMVGLPDIAGREKILIVHAHKVKLAPDVDMRTIAKGTPGFSGADLANLINEGALLAARRGRETIGMSELEEAKDRVMMGPERRSMVISEKEKLVTAYHEAGHALVSRFTPGGDAVHKITIIPRGPALGVTWILPDEERLTVTRQQLLNQLDYMMGGRAAEEIKFGEFTTGASNDIERATNLARRMVCAYGMSDRLGPRSFGEPSGHVFLGKEMTRERNYSEETATLIDEEIKRLIDESHKRALDLLRTRKDVLDRLAEALVERETIDTAELEMLVESKPLPPIERPKPEPRAPEPTDEKKTKSAAPKPKIDPLGGPQTHPSG
jgi:cell division protease FtsH